MDDYRRRRYLNADRGMSVDITASRRRLQALAYLGYTSRQIAQMCGKDYLNIGHFCDRQKTVWKDTAEALEKAYEKYSMITPEHNRATTFAKNYARRRGYVGPLAWDDETIDDPRALPQGVRRDEFQKWLNNQATDLQKQIWQEQQQAEKLSA
jgi:hypothetical protein